MRARYRVEQAEWTTVEDSIRRIYQQNLRPCQDALARFRWYYEDGPWGKGSVLVLYCEDDQQPGSCVVGYCGLTIRHFRFEGQTLRAGLVGDFAVEQAHRAAMPALMIQRAVMAYAKQHLDLLYGFPNDKAERILKRTGYKTIGRRYRHVRPILFDKYIDRVIDHEVMQRGAAIAVNAGAQVLEQAVSLFGRLTHRLRWLEDVDARFDALFESFAAKHAMVGVRSAEFLRWRFIRHPERHFDFAALTRHQGEVDAYAVVEVEAGDGVAHLRDLVGASEDHLDHLIKQLIPALRERGCKSVNVSYIGDPRLLEILRRNFFRARDDEEGQMTVLAVLNPELDCDRLMQLGNWYLMESDEDD